MKQSNKEKIKNTLCFVPGIINILYFFNLIGRLECSFIYKTFFNNKNICSFINGQELYNLGLFMENIIYIVLPIIPIFVIILVFFVQQEISYKLTIKRNPLIYSEVGDYSSVEEYKPAKIPEGCIGADGNY